MTTPAHVAIFMYGVSGGGVQRRNVTLANELAARGLTVDLVVLDGGGEDRGSVAPAVRVVELGDWRIRLPWVRNNHSRQFRAARGRLVSYLRRETPALLFSADNHANFTAVAARERAGRAVPLVVSQRNHASTSTARRPKIVGRIREAYPKADAIVCVSQGVADDLKALGLPAEKVLTIYNPVVGPKLRAQAAAEVGHPWFGVPGRPVILGVGRLRVQKNFEMLLRAFVRLRQGGSQARLLILGDELGVGARQGMMALAAELGVAEHVDLPGFVPDAVPYIARADLFALSSRWEGLPGVLIEALACGTPIVSTDCPSGPREVLDDGAFGRLVPVDDVEAFAAAMAATLAEPRDPERLKRRAETFSVDEGMRRYMDLFGRLTAGAVGVARGAADDPTSPPAVVPSMAR